MIELRFLWSHFTAMLVVALRSFAGTLVLFLAVGLALALMSYYVLRENTLYASLAALLAVVEAGAVGMIVGGKRGMVQALAHGVSRAQLGSAALRLCFERLLGVSRNAEFANRGGVVAQAAERIPLAEAEQRLSSVIEDLRRDSPPGTGITGWFRRQLHRGLLRLVRACTLAEFRAAGAQHGGVDLVKVQSTLEPRIDQYLANKLRRGTNWLLLAALAILLIVVALQTYGILKLIATR